jgi:hypothetical protein
MADCVAGGSKSWYVRSATVWLVENLLTAWLVLCPGSTGQQSGKLQVMRALGMSIDPTAPCCGRNCRCCAVR